MDEVWEALPSPGRDGRPVARAEQDHPLAGLQLPDLKEVLQERGHVLQDLLRAQEAEAAH